MRLPSAPFTHLLRHRPEIAPRIRAAFRRNFSALVGNSQPTHARYRLRNPAGISEALNRLQEELS